MKKEFPGWNRNHEKGNIEGRVVDKIECGKPGERHNLARHQTQVLTLIPTMFR